MYTIIIMFYTFRDKSTKKYFKLGDITRYANFYNRQIIPAVDINDGIIKKYSLKEMIYYIIQQHNFIKNDIEVVKYSKDLSHEEICTIPHENYLDVFYKIYSINISTWRKRPLINYLLGKKNSHKTKYVVIIRDEKIKSKDFPFKKGSFYTMPYYNDGRYIFLLDDTQLVLVKLSYSDYTLFKI